MNLLKLMDELKSLRERFPPGANLVAEEDDNTLCLVVYMPNGYRSVFDITRESIVYTLEYAMESRISWWVEKCIRESEHEY